MKAKLVAFGEVQLKGQRYAHDVAIEARRIRRRRKGPSKALRAQIGHTPSFLRTHVRAEPLARPSRPIPTRVGSTPRRVSP